MIKRFKSQIEKFPPEFWEKHLGCDKVGSVKVGRVVSRPFSVVARCEIACDEKTYAIYIKQKKSNNELTPVESEQMLQTEFDDAKRWYDLFCNSSSYHVVKPLFCLPEDGILVSEESPGSSFYEMVEKGASRFSGHGRLAELIGGAEQIGGWVAYKNSLTRVENRTYTLSDLVDYLQVRFDILTGDKRRKFDAALPAQIISFICDNWNHLSPEHQMLTQSHSDFNPGNILVDGPHVTVLDFGKLTNDSYVLDIAKLYHALYLWTFKPQFGPKVIVDLQQALLRGFGEPELDRTYIFKFMLIRNLVTHITNISRFWLWNPVEKIYNRWVMQREIQMIKSIIANDH